MSHLVRRDVEQIYFLFLEQIKLPRSDCLLVFADVHMLASAHIIMQYHMGHMVTIVPSAGTTCKSYL